MGLPEWLKRIVDDFDERGEHEKGRALIDSIPSQAGRRPERYEPDYRWIPPGEQITIQGFDIPGGMIYVGKTLAPLSQHFVRSRRSNDPALIDPGLSAQSYQPDRTGRGLDYWPWYAKIPLASRAAYLEWLAGGRRDPSIPVGYVFLFFYGLERRALADEPTPEDCRAIRQEVDELLATYGRDNSFANYATSLLSALDVLSTPPGAEIGPVPEVSDRIWEVPPSLRFGLGRMAADKQPIPSDWALAWLISHPNLFLRTPAQRCPDEFSSLWHIRYQQRFGDGIVVKPGKARVTPTHRPASPSFGGIIRLPAPNVPDISDLRSPLNKLDDLRAECEDELDAYSRYLGKRPEATASLAGSALLPAELVQQQSHPALDDLRAWLNDTLQNGETKLINGEDILGHWPERMDNRAKSESLAIAQLLAKLGVGIEPDVRFGGKALANAPVAMFRQPLDAPSAPTAEYASTATMLHLVAAVATADGKMNNDEMKMLCAHLETSMHLSDVERQRLQAHVMWLGTGSIAITGMTRRVRDLPEERRADIARFAIAMASADGPVRAQEIKVLEKIFTLLGLDPGGLYSQLHGTGREPVRIEKGERAQGYAIPSAPATEEPKKPEPFQLDTDRIEATMRESARVANFLGDIFVDEETPAAKPTQQNQDTVEGLDSAHSTFLRKLGEHDEWSRGQVVELAESLGLLPDGAIDTLNELAFDRCDEPVCEGDDDVTINRAVFEEMLQ